MSTVSKLRVRVVDDEIIVTLPGSKREGGGGRRRGARVDGQAGAWVGEGGCGLLGRATLGAVVGVWAEKGGGVWGPTREFLGAGFLFVWRWGGGGGCSSVSQEGGFLTPGG